MPDLSMPPLRPEYLPIREAGGFLSSTRAWLRYRRQWTLLEDWHYRLPNGIDIILPAGFSADGASAPRLFWGLMPPAGPLLLPSLIHDFAYRYDYLWTPDGIGGYCKYSENAGRAHWDRLFHETGLQLVGRNLFTLPAGSVMRLLGGHAWRRWRRTLSEEIRPGAQPVQHPPADHATDAPRETGAAEVA